MKMNRICRRARDERRAPRSFLATPRHLKLDRTEWGDDTVALYSALRQPPRSDGQFFFDRGHLDLACKRDVNEHIISFFASDG